MRDARGCRLARVRVVGLKAVEEAVARYDDPEALFLFASFFGLLHESGRCLTVLDRVVSAGFFVAPTLEKSAAFEGVRELPEFQDVLARARRGRDAAEVAFRDTGGGRLLGI